MGLWATTAHEAPQCILEVSRSVGGTACVEMVCKQNQDCFFCSKVEDGFGGNNAIQQSAKIKAMHSCTQTTIILFMVCV